MYYSMYISVYMFIGNTGTWQFQDMAILSKSI